MDKTTATFTQTRPKKGFALFITLSVLMVLISLTVVLLGYFAKVQRDATDTTAMIQANVYFSDIVSKFKKIGHKNMTSLYNYTSSMQSGRFNLSIRCAPLSKGVNINWLALENTQKMYEAYSFAQTVFDFLAQNYNFKDAQRLREMLLEEIGGKNKFVKKEYSRLRQKNGIISYKQFLQIVSRYQLEVDDSRIRRVPWGKYFTFSDKATVIDAEYSSAELLSLLFDIDLSTVKEWQGNPERSSLQAFVKGNNQGAYQARKKIIAGKNFLEESECTVSYKSGNKQYKFRFEYLYGEAKHFEFYDK